MLPEHGTDIPFTIENYAYVDSLGPATVSWVRIVLASRTVLQISGLNSSAWMNKADRKMFLIRMTSRGMGLARCFLSQLQQLDTSDTDRHSEIRESR